MNKIRTSPQRRQKFTDAARKKLRGETAPEGLDPHCRHDDISLLQLIIDCRTRWNSVQAMIVRALIMRPVSDSFRLTTVEFELMSHRLSITVAANTSFYSISS